jgi:predicted nucleotidyltransferase
MNSLGLNSDIIYRICNILNRYRCVVSASIFGSRAKGNYSKASDIDIALYGEMPSIICERIASDLDDLPYPYSFDVVSYINLNNEELAKHIDRVGVQIYDGKYKDTR